MPGKGDRAGAESEYGPSLLTATNGNPIKVCALKLNLSPTYEPEQHQARIPTWNLNVNSGTKLSSDSKSDSWK